MKCPTCGQAMLTEWPHDHGPVSERKAASGDVEAACAHLNVQSWADPSGIPTLWACDDCHRRFYPACPECVAVGHRNVVHEAVIRAESAGLDVERLARALRNIAPIAYERLPDLARESAEALAAEYARLAEDAE